HDPLTTAKFLTATRTSQGRHRKLTIEGKRHAIELGTAGTDIEPIRSPAPSRQSSGDPATEQSVRGSYFLPRQHGSPCPGAVGKSRRGGPGRRDRQPRQ